MTTVPIIKGDRIENADYRDALPINMYTVARSTRGFDGYLINQPGISFLGSTEGVDRGGFYSTTLDSHFRVTGTSFIEVDELGSTTVLGTVTGSLQVQIDESSNNIAIVADGKLWYYNRTDGLRQINDPNLGNPIDIAFISGVFLFTDGESLYHTSILDEETIEPLDFASSELAPDPIVGIAKTSDGQAIVWNSNSTEWFFFDGGENFAFSRIQGKATEFGMVATDCNAKIDGGFFVLGRRKEESLSVGFVSASAPQSISTREIDKLLDAYTKEELQTASLETREDDGYKFLHINLPDMTLLFNWTIAKTIGVEYAWSILKTSTTIMDGWSGINGIWDERISKWVYGDRFNPRLGVLDNTISTLYDEEVECVFYSPFMTMDSQSIDQIEIKTISGFTPQRATVSMSLSCDGEIYGKEWWAMYGDKRERAKRFIIRRIGNVNDYVGMKFRAVTPSRLAFGAIEVKHG